jgi:hypothetical protein
MFWAALFFRLEKISKTGSECQRGIMNAISILKGFARDSFEESIKRFENYKMIYFGLIVVNILIRIPSSHLGYNSANIFYSTFVSIILQVCISVLMANLIISKVALDKNKPKADLVNSSLKSIKGQILYYVSAAIGFFLLIVPAFFALFFFCLTPILEILEEHKGLSSLKRSHFLVRKDLPLVLALSIVILVFYIVLELIFSRLRSTGLGIVIYIISALITTFISIIITLIYVRLISYLKDLKVVGILNEDEIPPPMNSSMNKG